MKISDVELVVVDVETTGLDPSKDRLVEFALRDAHWNIDFLVDPGISIPPQASATHHLQDIDVRGEMPHGIALERIARLIPEDAIVCAHNAPFDSSFLTSIADRRWICTQRLTQHLEPLMPDFKNQTLRYAFLGDLDRSELKAMIGDAPPHRAKADVAVTWLILQRLLRLYHLNFEDDSVGALLAFMGSPIRVLKWGFGKHKGQNISDTPRDYIEWALGPRGMTDMDADLRWTLEQELVERDLR